MMGVGGWDKLILIDDASAEEANLAYHDAVAELGPNASVLRMEHNDALRAGNAGVEALGTDIVIGMVNDLVMTDERWLEWAVEGIERGIIQGPQCWFRGMIYVDGCMTVMMREDWELLGGADAEHYAHPGYWADTDFSLRAQQHGMIVRPTRSGIRHLVNYSSGDGPAYLAENEDNYQKYVVRSLFAVRTQLPVPFRNRAEAQ